MTKVVHKSIMLPTGSEYQTLCKGSTTSTYELSLSNEIFSLQMCYPLYSNQTPRQYFKDSRSVIYATPTDAIPAFSLLEPNATNNLCASDISMTRHYENPAIE